MSRPYTCAECEEDYDADVSPPLSWADHNFGLVCENCFDELDAKRREDMHEQMEHLPENGHDR